MMGYVGGAGVIMTGIGVWRELGEDKKVTFGQRRVEVRLGATRVRLGGQLGSTVRLVISVNVGVARGPMQVNRDVTA